MDGRRMAGAVADRETPVVGSGPAFSAAFYAAMHRVTGPLLGVKPPEWRSDAGPIGLHAVDHLGFGLLAAAGARTARAG